MKKRCLYSTRLLIVAVVFSLAQAATAQGLFGGKPKVEADPQKDYYLKDSDGAWFVMAKKFSGADAAYNAKKLTYEFRAAAKIPAYVFKYDPDQMDMDALSQNLGKTKRFHYQTARAVEYAVLVGGYPTGEDPSLQKTLEAIRKFSPRSLKDDPQSKAAAERFKESAKRDSKYAGYGPLGGATPVPNPLLPSEYFNHKGVVDPFVAKLNSDSPYSLLNNKKTYTVRVATFSGDTSMKKNSESFDDLNGRLQYAGLRAAALCEALRNSGVEAWEFHDRDCSFVTIGGFDQYGKLQADGHVELDPQIAAIMKKYGGELATDASGATQYKSYTVVVEIPDPASSKLNPKKKKMSLACDLRPVIIVVPQRSGEESVKKIALAQEQMTRAQKRKDAINAEESLREAENDLANARVFSDPNQILTEEELKKLDPEIFAAMQASKKTPGAAAAPVSSTAQAAPTNERYSSNAQSVQPTTSGVANARPNVATTQRNAAPQAATTPNVNAQRREQARAANVPAARPSKTAQRPVAPTY